MSWTPIHPDAAPKGYTPAVTVTVSSQGLRFRQKMTLTIRSRLIDGMGAWCAPGAVVSVQRGQGEHAGMLRLSPKGPWRLCKPSGSAQAASLILVPPPGVPADGCRQVPVAFRHGPDWIEVTLPPWENAVAPMVKPAYVGISERVPDPAKAIQAANGARVR